ncbi:MAG: glycosyltransferase [Desulfobacterales bacterium]|nr:glycosyltransferase [Desulfobacterales bacterium]
MEIKTREHIRPIGESRDPIQVSVVVLFYHGVPWVRPCVGALLDQSMDRSRYELIFADNGGSTPSLDAYRDEVNVRIVRWKQNLGFTGGNNRAAELARGRVIFLLNQDVVAHYRCLESVWEGLKRHPKLDVVSANMQMTTRLENVDRKKTPSTLGVYRLSPFGYADYRSLPTQSDPVSVDFVSGNGLGFRKTVLPKVGGYLFDERLFNYAEDLDLSLRLARSGCRMAVLPAATIYHFRHDPDAGPLWPRLKKFAHISGNRLLVYHRQLPAGLFLKKLPLLLAGIPLKVGRMDAEQRFRAGRFLAATVLVPLAALDFVKKSIRQRKLPTRFNDPQYRVFSGKIRGGRQ